MFPKRAWKTAKYSRVGGTKIDTDCLRHFALRERERKEIREVEG